MLDRLIDGRKVASVAAQMDYEQEMYDTEEFMQQQELLLETERKVLGTEAQWAVAEAEAEKSMERRTPQWMMRCQWFKPQRRWLPNHRGLDGGWVWTEMLGLVVPRYDHKDFDKWLDQVPHPQNEHEEHEFFLAVGHSFAKEFEAAYFCWMDELSDRQLQSQMP
jgi:hypothetical protein